MFLDSVDQLTGAQDVNKVSWLPTKLPPYCKVIYFLCSFEFDTRIKFQVF